MQVGNKSIKTQDQLCQVLNGDSKGGQSRKVGRAWSSGYGRGKGVKKLGSEKVRRGWGFRVQVGVLGKSWKGKEGERTGV